MQELEKCSTSHVMVLFRDVIGFKFRGLYSFTPESDQVLPKDHDCSRVMTVCTCVCVCVGGESVWNWSKDSYC